MKTDIRTEFIMVYFFCIGLRVHSIVHWAAAGKNPVSHVGKIYNQLARQTAERICQHIDAVEEACVWLCSRIGAPLDEPWVASVQVALKPDATIADVRTRIQDLVANEVLTVSVLTHRLTRGELTVC